MLRMPIEYRRSRFIVITRRLGVELASYVIVAGTKSQVASSRIESVLFSVGAFSSPRTSRLFWLSPAAIGNRILE
jgi:hypothetical protein